MRAQVRPGGFKLAWFVAGIAVVPLSVALTIVVLMAAGALLNIFDDSWYLVDIDGLAICLAIFWLVNGFCIGLWQKAIVKRFLRVDLGRWMVYSALGALLAGAIAYPCQSGWCLPRQLYDDRFPLDLNATFEFSRILFLYLTVFSAVQILALKRIVSGSWRWIAAHSGSVFLAAIAAVAAQLLPGPSSFNTMLNVSFYVLVVTVASGLVMLRMLTANRVATKDALDEWAYQQAPLESGAAPERSVWDDAI